MFMPRSTDDKTLEDKVQLLMDERAIRDVIYRDCRAKSRGDSELMKSCFHGDAVDEHGPWFSGPVSLVYDGLETFHEKVAGMIEYFTTQILIDIEGDVANVESYQMSAKVFHERSDDGHQILRLSGMRNLDRFERRNGEWRIAKRRFIPEWGFFTEVPPLERDIGGTYGIGTVADRVFAARSGDRGVAELVKTLRLANDQSDPSYSY